MKKKFHFEEQYTNVDVTNSLQERDLEEYVFEKRELPNKFTKFEYLKNLNSSENSARKKIIKQRVFKVHF